MGLEILLSVGFFLLLLNFISLDITVSKMKKDRLKLDVVTAITALEIATRKLNEKLKCETQSLSDYKQRLRNLEKRLDILEADHPDSEIDYGEVDDDANVIAVWFDGKKYVPEDKQDEDTIKIYVDNKVMVETTRPEEKRCCATCRHYRPGPDHTCTIRPWLCTSPARAAESSSICNNYKKTERDCYSATKGQVDYPYTTYKDMGGNGKAEDRPEFIIKLNYIASDAECDELLKRVERLNRIYDAGLLSLSEYGDRLKEMMQNDI